MSKFSRSKGKRGELEAIHQLEALTGLALAREHGQSAVGGHDCTVRLAGGAVVCLEIKRCETEEHGPWWEQATASSARVPGGVPVVVWRRSRQPWRVRVPLGWLRGEPWPLDGWADSTAVISLESFAQLLRVLTSVSTAPRDRATIELD
jgi:hypothetical protein